MHDAPKTNRELIEENILLKSQIKQLRKSEAERARLRSEEDIAKSEREKAVILDTMSEIVVYVDRDMNVVWANRAMYEIFGLNPEAFEGSHCYRYHGQDKPCSFCPAVMAMKTGRPHVHDDLRSYGKRWVLRGYPVRDENDAIIGAVEIVTDVTDVRNALDALKESEGKFRDLSEKSIVGVYLIQDGVFKYVNAKFAEIFGYSSDEITGRIRPEDAVYSEDWPRVKESLSRRMSREQSSIVYDFRILTKSRTIRNVEVYSSHTVYQGKPAVIGTMIDMTERRRVDEALHNTRAKMEAAIKGADLSVYDWNMKTGDIDFDDRYVGMLGYTKEDFPKLDAGIWRKLVHPDDLQHCIGKISEIVSGKSSGAEMEYRLRSATGDWVWVLDRGVVVERNEKGRPVRFLGTHLDITKRKLAEESLIESRQQLANIIDFLPDATFVIDREGKVIAWNRALEDMTGVDASAMVGRDNYEYALPFYGKRRPILIDLVLKRCDRTETQYESLARRDLVLTGEAYLPALKAGGCHIYAAASTLRDSKGEIVGAIESIRDITDRKRAEKKYQDIFENAIMGIFQATPGGRIISANPAFARTAGYDSPEDLIAAVSDISRQFFVSRERWSELMHIIGKSGSVREFDIEVMRKDSRIIWITVNAKAVLNSSGHVLYYEGTIQDITARKALESQLRQSQKMEAIGTLAGGIAHDFNNILSVIMGYTDMAMGKLEDGNPLHRYLDQIFKAGERARDLVRQILAFSRQSEEILHPLRISPIIKESLKLLRSSLPTTIQITQEIQAERDTVLAAPTHIHQIMMNLCSNAAHAMKERKGALKIRLVSEEIVSDDQSAPQALTPGMYLKLTVSDTGAGIDPLNIRRIFDPFFTTKKPGEGTGLGLSVVYGIVKSYGGEITVQSDPGRGTDVSVYLPLLTDDETGDEQQVQESIPLGRESILFVDDEGTLVDIGRAILAGLGYEVTASTASIEALELFKADPERFDLVITDMTMPDMTGLELSREMMGIRPDLPVILCTGFSEAVTPEKVEAAGLKALIMKPIIRHQLAVTIRKVLDRDK